MNTNIKTREYTTVSEVSGPLMIVEGVEGVGYNEIVDIETPTGEKRSGQVLEVTKDVAVIQFFVRNNFWSTINRFTNTVKDTSHHVSGYTDFCGLTSESCFSIFSV